MGANSDVAAIFREIADLLDLAGERFKPEAYRRAARSLEALPEDLRAYADRGEVGEIPAIGAALAEKIQEFLTTGSIPYLTKLQGEFPAGIVALTRLSGLGPKTARRFWLELGVIGPAELDAAIAAGRLNGLKGFGPRKIELIRQALAAAATPNRRLPLAEADGIARTIVASLRARAPLDAIELAGSYRRSRETVGDLDVLTTSRETERVLDAFTTLPGIARQLMRGPTKATVVLEGGLQVDLRVVAPEEFGAALQYFTGSKDHNVHIRSLARDAGLRINEYGVFRGEERITGATESEVYASLGLPWIPPEIREDQGEIEAAQQGALPHLVELSSLHGDLHVHLGEGATVDAVRSTLAEANGLGWEYIGFAVPCTGAGVSPTATLLRSVDSPRPRILVGAEGTPSALAALADDQFDYTIELATDRNEPNVGPPPKRTSARPRLTLSAHQSPGSAAPDPKAARGKLKAAGPTPVIGPDAPTLGVDSATLRGLADSGRTITLSSNSPDGRELGRIRLAVGFARRGWTTAATVLNAGSWPERRKAPPYRPSDPQ